MGNMANSIEPHDGTLEGLCRRAEELNNKALDLRRLAQTMFSALTGDNPPDPAQGGKAEIPGRAAALLPRLSETLHSIEWAQTEIQNALMDIGRSLSSGAARQEQVIAPGVQLPKGGIAPRDMKTILRNIDESLSGRPAEASPSIAHASQIG